MVFLLCPDDPQSTHVVIAYLISKAKKVIRIDESTKVQLEKLCLKSDSGVEAVISINNQLIDLNEINSCWYRGGAFHFSSKENIKPEFYNYIIQEEKTLASFFYRFSGALRSCHRHIERMGPRHR